MRRRPADAVPRSVAVPARGHRRARPQRRRDPRRDRRASSRAWRSSRRRHAEVEKAKAIAETDFWTSLVDVDGKAEALGHYETALGDFRKAQHDRRAARAGHRRGRRARACATYLRRDRRTIVIAEPEDRRCRRRRRGRRRGADALTPIVIVEPSPDTPLVWFDVAIRGGASLDPLGIEGLHRHAALLARRGAGRRDRAELDDTLDGLGAALDVGVSPRRGHAVGPRAVAPPRRGDRARRRRARRRRGSPTTSTRACCARRRRCSTRSATTTARSRRAGSTGCAARATPTAGPRSAPRRRSRGSMRERARSRVAARGRRRQPRDRPRGRCRRGHAPRASSQRLDRAAAARRAARSRSSRASPTAPPRGRRVILVDKPDRTQAQLRIGHLSAALRRSRHRRARDRRGRVRRDVQLAADAGDPGQARLELRRRLRAAPVAAAALVRDLDGRRRSTSPGRPSRSRSICSPTTRRTDRPTTRSTSRAATSIGAMPFHVATARQRMQLAVRDAVFELPPATPRASRGARAAHRRRRARRVHAAPAPRRRGHRRGDDRRAARERALAARRRPADNRRSRRVLRDGPSRRASRRGPWRRGASIARRRRRRARARWPRPGCCPARRTDRRSSDTRCGRRRI